MLNFTAQRDAVGSAKADSLKADSADLESTDT